MDVLFVTGLGGVRSLRGGAEAVAQFEYHLTLSVCCLLLVRMSSTWVC